MTCKFIIEANRCSCLEFTFTIYWISFNLHDVHWSYEGSRTVKLCPLMCFLPFLPSGEAN